MRYFKATHSSGRVELRSSSHAAYTWACIGPLRGSATFHARKDLAQGEQSRRAKWYDNLEVVQAAEIDKAEYAALVKASKLTFKVKYMGKVYTKTCSAETKRPYICAVGYDQPAITVWHADTRTAEQKAERLAFLRKCCAPSEGTIQREEAVQKAGGWSVEHRAQRGVFWFDDRREAEKYLADRIANQSKPDAIPATYEMVEMI